MKIIHFFTVGSEVPPSRTYAVSGLEPGQQYDIRVTAFNAAGSTHALYKITTPSRGNTGKPISIYCQMEASKPK